MRLPPAQFVRDGARHFRHVLQGIVRSEDGHLVAHVYTGRIGKVNHAHVHADFTPYRCRTFRRHQSVAVGKAAQEAVRISVRHHADSRGMGGLENSAVADVRSGRVDFDGADNGLQGHYRTKSQLLRIVSVSVQQQARSNHVQIGFRIFCRGPGIGTVANPELMPPLFFRAPNHIGEQLKLVPGVFQLIRTFFIRHRKMSKDAFRIQARKGAGMNDAVHTVLEIIPLAEVSQPGHARIHLDVNLQGAPVFHRLLAVLQRLGLTGHRLGDIKANQPIHLLLRRVPQNQNRHGDAVEAKLQSLVDAAHRQVIRPQLLQLCGHLQGAMTVGIRLHHAQEAHIRPNVFPNRVIIICEGVQIDFRPRPFQC